MDVIGHEQHPPHDLLEGFFGGRLTAEENRQVVGHLLQGCGSCRRRSRRLWPVESPAAGVVAGPGHKATEGDYVGSVAAALSGLAESRSAVDRERQYAEDLVEELLAVPFGARHHLISGAPRFRSFSLGRLLVQRAFDQGFQDPIWALELARTAVLVAAGLPENTYPQPLIRDLEARAHLHLANARRINGDLAGAAGDLRIAESRLKAGTGDPLERAWLLRLRADLEGERRDFAAVEASLAEATGIYHRLEDDHLLGCTLIDLGTHLGEAGRTAEAIRHLRDGLRLVDIDDTRHRLMATHNLVLYLLDAGEDLEAERRLDAAAPLYRAFGGAMTDIRRRWLEGKVHLALGRLESAEEALLEVRSAFADREIAHDMAFAALDLSLVYLRQGRTSEIKRLAVEMIAVFKARGTTREQSAAWLLFLEAVERERLTIDWIRALGRFLEEAPNDPEVPFEPPVG